MKKFLCLLIALSAFLLSANTISESRAKALANSILNLQSGSHCISELEVLRSEQTDLAYIYALKPTGYMVISAHDTLPPLVAYSVDSDFGFRNTDNPLRTILKADLSQRLQLNDVSCTDAWQRAESSPRSIMLVNDYLLNTNWNQTAPWNAMCPLDPISNSRSVAGCPAVAMAQIVNHLQSMNNTRFDDSDDYYHAFSGRNYTIDDDFETMDFPPFPELNAYLDQVQTAFNHDELPSSELQAALVFACGTACKQIYSSQVSGTLSVNQAYAAFQRFGFPNVGLLGPEHPQLYTRMIQNIEEGIPLLLAMVTPAEDAGHNVVVDGYNEGMYHLNFGWGGQYNGWYSLPEGVPYNLTVVEGAVIDLQPAITMIGVPDALEIASGGSQQLEVVNLSALTMQLVDLQVGTELNAAEWQISPAPGIATIEAYGSIVFSITNLVPTRDIIESTIRLVFDNAWLEIPIVFRNSSATDDSEYSPVCVSILTSPNPFSQSCEFHVSGTKSPINELRIYNLKGQLVHQSHHNIWDGRDSLGQACPTGLYFYRINGEDFSKSGKLIKQ